MYIKDPSQGAVNAGIGAVKDWFTTPGALSDASPSTSALTGSPSTGYKLHKPIAAGGVAELGLTAIPPSEVPASAKQAATPQPRPGAIDGVVWRDFKPGGGVPGKVEQGEQGLPGVVVELFDSSGQEGAVDHQRGRRLVRVHGPHRLRVCDRRRRGDVREAVRRGLLARLAADHAGDHHRLHLGVGRLRDGA